MKRWDVIIIGGGIIGLSLSIALRKQGVTVLVVERGEPGREASHAAAGMLADFSVEIPLGLQSLATASARMYPEFVHELQDESGTNVDLRDEGTIFFATPDQLRERPSLMTDCPLPSPLSELEPALGPVNLSPVYLKERSVDPRALTAAALKAARHRGVDIVSGTAVTDVLLANGSVSGVGTGRTSYSAAVVVNCAGAWAGQLPPLRFPTRPVKGQMLSLAGAPRDLVASRHSCSRNLSGAAQRRPHPGGRDRRRGGIRQAHRCRHNPTHAVKAAIRLLPALAQARMLEAWAGLRPGSPDNLPILGATRIPGYFVASGHFRDGILLAPVTAQVMAQMVIGGQPEYDVSPFSPARFQN